MEKSQNIMKLTVESKKKKYTGLELRYHKNISMVFLPKIKKDDEKTTAHFISTMMAVIF